MTHPSNGDYASYLDQLAARQPAGPEEGAPPARPHVPDEGFLLEEMASLSVADQVSVDAIAAHDAGRSMEELDQLAQLEELPPVSDEELERQALENPGEPGLPPAG
jgi:hypothetical protein